MRCLSDTASCASSGDNAGGPIPARRPVQTEAPNQVWSADFKGQFKTGDGWYCYPLTITDHFSRTLLAFRGLPSVRTACAQPVFRALFREVGLPEAIRTDNGAPFASTGIHGLSALNVWWMQLGIVHQRILPASPQENGQHETDASRTEARDHPPGGGQRARPATSLRPLSSALQHGAPPEGIGDRTPASLWTTSTRDYPERLTAVLPRACGSPTRQHSRHLPPALATALPQSGAPWRGCGPGRGRRRDLEIVYYRTLLGKIDERTLLITGV